MTRYFVLVKKRGSSSWKGAVPARKGVSLATLKRVIKKSIKKGFVAKIISEAQLKRFLLKNAPKSRMSNGKKVRRVKRRRRTTHKRRRTTHKRRRRR